MVKALLSNSRVQVVLVLFVLIGSIGIFYLPAAVFSPPPLPPVPRQAPVSDAILPPAEEEVSGVPAGENGFLETIIANNLFAPLGTVLNAESVPGADLTLVATSVSADPWQSTALLQNKTTHAYYRLGIGDVIADFTVMKIEPKQVTLDHHGQAPVVLRLPHAVFLNVKRR